MATFTTNLNLRKPATSDTVNVTTDISDNMDAIDTAVAARVTKALVDAKGDLIVASAADTVARLAVGANTYVLTADSAEATGVKWAQSGSDVWSNYTPTLTQSGAVTKTVTYARYTQQGKTVHVVVSLAATAAGTASNVITVSLPVAAHASLTAGVGTIGAGRVYDASAGTVYRGVTVMVTTTTIRIEGTGESGTGLTGSGLGATGTPFTDALASGDQVDFCATYEAA